jgi:hypothetical protein
MRGAYTKRHDKLKIKLVSLGAEAGYTDAPTEVQFPPALTGIANQPLKMDIDFESDHFPMMVDVSFITTCTAARTRAGRQRLANEPTYLICARELEKITKYTGLADARQVPIYPVVFDTLGTPGAHVSAFIGRLVMHAQQSSTSTMSSAQATSYFSSRLAVLVQCAVCDVAFRSLVAPLATHLSVVGGEDGDDTLFFGALDNVG